MRFIKKLGLVLTVVAIVLMALPNHIALAQSATVAVNGGATINLAPGASGGASVDVSSITGLGPGNGVAGWDITLSWDPAVIRMDSVTEGTPSGSIVFVNPTDFPYSGSVNIAGITTTYITGGFNVASLSFTAVGSGGDSTTISVSGSLIDKDNIPLSISWVGAPVQITQQYTLIVNTSGTAGTASGAGVYNSGQTAFVTAIPGVGSQFDNWTGDVANPNSASTTVFMDASKTVTANFSAAPDVTLTMAVDGNGSTDPSVGDHDYPVRSVVDITATPDPGWLFDNWSGAVANSNSATTTVFMDVDKTVTANFSPAAPVTLTMAVTGSGSTSPSVGEHDYPVSTVVNITATPAAGWQFDDWTGDVANSGSASTTVTMDADKTVTANFSEIPVTYYTLTMAVSGNGSTNPSVGDHDYVEDTVVSVTATPASGWQFDNWTGAVANPTSASTTVTMSLDRAVTASFSEIPEIYYTLTMAVSGDGLTSPTVGIHTYAEGTVVSVGAIAAAGSQFNNWTGVVANSNSASTTVIMNSNKTVTANFSEIPVIPETFYTLTMAVTGDGSTSPSLGSHTYAAGTVVPVGAIPAGGSQFDHWTGTVVSSGSASTTVTMNGNKTVTANFSEIPEIPQIYYTLTMAANGDGSTSPPAGSQDYLEGTAVPVGATPASGWQFDNWTGAVANAGSASTTVTMNADKTVTANFSLILIEDVTAPVILAVSASNITKTGADINWATDEPANSQVDFWASPGELTPLDETLLTEHLVHLTDLPPATTYYYKVMSRDGAGNMTVSDEYTFTTAGLPATFVATDWDISITEVETGKEVTVSFLLTNAGDISGSHEVVLTVNEIVSETRVVTLDAGTGEELTFTITEDAVGTYLVSVDGFTASFFVEVKPAKPIDWLLVLGIAAGIVLLLILIVLLIRRAEEKAGEGPESVAGETAVGKVKAFVSGMVGQVYHRQSLETKEAKERARKEAAEAIGLEEGAGQEVERIRQEAERIRQEAERKGRREAERAGETTRPEQPDSGLYIDMKGGGKVLTVTALAVTKLKEAIRDLTKDPEIGIRFMPSAADPNQFEMVLDKEKEGDQVVESEGLKILLLRPELSATLGGMVIDCQETPQGVRFTVLKPKLSPDS